LKIALVSPEYWPHRGGVEKYVQEIATRFAQAHDVSVLTTDPNGTLPESEEMQGVRIRRFRSFAPDQAIYYSGGMLRYLRRHSSTYDIVHANNYHALPAFFAAESKRSRLVFTPHFHGTVGHSAFRNFLHIPYRILGRRIFAKADAVICCTRFERNAILRRFRVPQSKLIMIREGINRVRPTSELHEKRHNMILTVSRLEKYKGVQHILRSLPYLPSFKLTIVGSGPYGAPLCALTDSLGLQERVVFTHDIDDQALSYVYGESDVAVLLSEHEQYSYFVGEALSAGIPCVVANRDALVEWVDGESCIGIDDPTNPRAVAEAIVSVTERKVSRTLPTWDDYVAELGRLYENLL
jgi:glycosyltransferase involved in cell wall biosynthesis